MKTQPLYREDAYLRRCEARVLRAGPEGIVLDRTVFYPTGGGQPGDSGTLLLEDGSSLAVREARKGEEPGSVLHLPADDAALPAPGTPVEAAIDWDRRYRLMRTHTCLHLLCRAVDGVVTGGSVGELKGRLDFDIPEPLLEKEAIEAQLAAWVGGALPVSARWVEEEELDRRPELVRTLSVQPPRGHGRIRLVGIEGVDLQACGGTHVRSTTEIGPVTVAKIEKKGRMNRRVVVTLGA
ncbi:alanyl-tRNA editing protein [Marinimicrococcus flavescens]|uniref:Alanine--tRNA ligase n=1 Tax=Marinimicrococcus flavescens TaxID=3031815 RepID=A0AAP3XSB0_9PROT|nr:alanyl-tRNA editing protein [Marinimicrococcus flavescens]